MNPPVYMPRYGERVETVTGVWIAWRPLYSETRSYQRWYEFFRVSHQGAEYWIPRPMGKEAPPWTREELFPLWGRLIDAASIATLLQYSPKTRVGVAGGRWRPIGQDHVLVLPSKRIDEFLDAFKELLLGRSDSAESLVVEVAAEAKKRRLYRFAAELMLDEESEDGL